jgi:DNA-binding SARP family transcriptional activator
MGCTFAVLGPLEIRQDTTAMATAVATVPRVKPRQLLALLLINANRAVGIDHLIDELWSTAPRSALANLRTYVADLRRISTIGAALDTRPNGYLLRVPDDAVDLAEYERLVSAGLAALDRDQIDTAVEHLIRAERLWRGPAFAGLRGSPSLDAVAQSTESLRLSAIESLAEARLRRGADRALVPDLRRHLATHPLRERAWMILIRALYAAGDIAAALDAFRSARAKLVSMLGVEPGPELHALNVAVLRRDPALTRGAPRQLRPPGGQTFLPIPPEKTSRMSSETCGTVSSGYQS